MTIRLFPTASLCSMLAVAAPGSAQSSDADPRSLEPGKTVMTTPAGRYDAGALHRFILGDGHRDLWPVPVPARVLDLDRFAGGLTVLREGGGLQTRSLRFQGADAQEWNFRSVDKDATRALDPVLRNTIAADVMQDRISALMPLSAMVVDPLLEAAGVLHPDPELVVMPDDARLGEFREDFAGMLGWIEVRPDEGPDDTPGFAGSPRVVGSDRLLERLEEDGPENYLDAASFLRARLMDVFVGDWDRHPDQWRWAGFPEGDRLRFAPVPRDRDWALSRLDGVVGSISWAFWPHYVGFQQEFPSAFRATWSGRALDRRLLSELTRGDFVGVAADVQARLSDQVIDRAVGRLPAGYEQAIGDELRSGFRNRRNDLVRFAEEYYELLARWLDVHTTDQDEVALLVRQNDGSVEVRISLPGAEPHFERTLDPQDTEELRLYLHGGDDSVHVSGSGPGDIKLRIVGGGSDDTFVNETRHAAGRIYVYDDRGDNTFEHLGGARVDESEFEEPFDPSETTHQAPFRDWGARWQPLPVLTFDPDVGLFLGFGGLRTSYGFRAFPYNTRLELSGGVGTKPGRFRARLGYDFPIFTQWLRGDLHVLASGAEARRFHGFGNETPPAAGPEGSEFFRAEQREIQARLPLGISWSPDRFIRIGPVYKRFEPFGDDTTFVSVERPYGYQSFSEVGAVASFRWDTRDRRLQPGHGLLIETEGRYFPDALDVTEPFGGLRGWAAGFFTLPGRAGPTLAARVGGEKIWGNPPFQEAAYLGGATSLRGYRNQRFAGQASVFLNSELRFKIARLKILLPEDVGVYALADVGRVFVEGESSDTWHSAFGGGAWVSLMDVFTANLSVAASPEQTLVYFQSGFAFGY